VEENSSLKGEYLSDYWKEWAEMPTDELLAIKSELGASIQDIQIQLSEHKHGDSERKVWRRRCYSAIKWKYRQIRILQIILSRRKRGKEIAAYTEKTLKKMFNFLNAIVQQDIELPLNKENWRKFLAYQDYIQQLKDGIPIEECIIDEDFDENQKMLDVESKIDYSKLIKVEKLP
jgi:hypothetical protein